MLSIRRTKIGQHIKCKILYVMRCNAYAEDSTSNNAVRNVSEADDIFERKVSFLQYCFSKCRLALHTFQYEKGKCKIIFFLG